MNVAGALGAPSLPRFTTRESSPRAEEGAPPAEPRRAGATADFRKPERSAEPPPSTPRSASPAGRGSRQAPGAAAVAGRESTPPAVHGRPSVAVRRIVDAAVLLRPEKTTRLRIALHPEHLGELVVDLSLRGGEVHATVLAASEAAKDAIAAHLDDLQASLTGKRIPVGEIVVRVAGAAEEVINGPRSLGRHLLDLWA